MYNLKKGGFHMNLQELGKRLRQAREKYSFSQQEVERKLYFPQKSMTRIESGRRLPSTLELAKLAELFNLSISDLLSDEIQEDPLIALHRIAPGLEHDPNIKQEVDRCVLLCKEGVNLENLLGQPSRKRVVTYQLEQPLNYAQVLKQADYVAKEERKRLSIGNNPIGDIMGLLSSQGVWCAGIHLPQEMSGLYLLHPLIGKVVLINSKHAVVRQQFSCAHEYAHVLLDSDHPILISESSNSSDLIEKRANAFAASFLMPEEGIAETLQSLNKGRSSRISLAVFGVSEEVNEGEDRQLVKNQKISPQDVAFIALKYGVSYQAMVYRLYSLQYLSLLEKDDLLQMEEKGKQYLRLFDLEELDNLECKASSQKDLKVYVSRLVIEAYRQEKISRGRVIELSKLLKLSARNLLEQTDTNTDNDE
jgi:Zn-dependent peptidase ImmA (M78 family)/DNA-binding XRE family transcriptional regulator